MLFVDSEVTVQDSAISSTVRFTGAVDRGYPEDNARATAESCPAPAPEARWVFSSAHDIG